VGRVLTIPAACHPQPGDHGHDPGERLAAGYGDDDLFVIGWREELGL
jgi:hypothetical protein